MRSIQETLDAAGITFFERGWLSANNTLMRGAGPSALVDSGYSSHAGQTVALVQHAMGGLPLDRLLNSHLHSDHCGGNAALQAAYPALQTSIPPGLSSAVKDWDPVALTFEPTGQSCPPFTFSSLLLPGEEVQLGAWEWQIHAARGHDPHAVLLFQPDHRLLLSADALWENGFGVVFPELEGIDAFDEVGDTLDLIEKLAPLTVIPGHGRIFQDLQPALQRARTRLERFVGNPDRHHRHAIKVLIKFKLLEWQTVERSKLMAWCAKTPYLRSSMPDSGSNQETAYAWLNELLSELETSQALKVYGGHIFNS